jgi:hypothetical protein
MPIHFFCRGVPGGLPDAKTLPVALLDGASRFLGLPLASFSFVFTQPVVVSAPEFSCEL